MFGIDFKQFKRETALHCFSLNCFASRNALPNTKELSQYAIVS